MKQEPETTDTFIYTEEEIENISKLVRILKSIRARLIREGVDLDFWRNGIRHNEKAYAASEAEVDL